MEAYLKYILPLFPTLATVKCRPSRPAEPPSGVISDFCPSPSLFPRGYVLPSCDLRSVTGTSGLPVTEGFRVVLGVTLGVATASLAAVSPDRRGDTLLYRPSLVVLLGEGGVR